MTAFLRKLKIIIETVPHEVATFNREGNAFQVIDEPKFEHFISKFFKGNLNTFIRQLHFYGFSKSEAINGIWDFTHPMLMRHNLDNILGIKRKAKRSRDVQSSRRPSVSSLPDSVYELDEVDELKQEIKYLKSSFMSEMCALKSTIQTLAAQLNDRKRKQLDEMAEPAYKKQKSFDYFETPSYKTEGSLESSSLVDLDLLDLPFEDFAL